MFRKLLLAFVVLSFLLVFTLIGIFGFWIPARSRSQIDIKFSGITNNVPAFHAVLGTNDQYLAVFTVTNRGTAPIQAVGLYYIEMDGWAYNYGGVFSSGEIPAQGTGAVVTRIPTNGVPWRVMVPFNRRTLLHDVANMGEEFAEDLFQRPAMDFRRYVKNAPKCDWVPGDVVPQSGSPASAR